jgi:hypothetical protein
MRGWIFNARAALGEKGSGTPSELTPAPQDLRARPWAFRPQGSGPQGNQGERPKTPRDAKHNGGRKSNIQTVIFEYI